MRFFKLLILVLLPTIVSANSNEYFSLGDWSLQAKRLATLPLFSAIEEVKPKKEYSVLAQSILGEKIPTILSFRRGRLHSLEFSLYEGQDENLAILSLQKTLHLFTNNFGGGHLEGLTTSEGLTDDLVEVIIKQVLGKVQAGISETENEIAKKIYFEITLSFSTENIANKNYLYGQYHYDSISGKYKVTLWEDLKFEKKRLPETMVILKSGNN